MITNQVGPFASLEMIAEHPGQPQLAIRQGPGAASLSWRELDVGHAHSSALPLQSSSLSLVLLNHVIADGEEPELQEACRVLQPGGRLFILGLNRYGLRYVRRRTRGALPGLRPLSVRARLEALDMRVLVMHAAGFLCGARPAIVSRGFTRVLTPLADLFLIVAKPVEPRIMNPVSKSKLRAVAAPSALAGR